MSIADNLHDLLELLPGLCGEGGALFEPRKGPPATRKHSPVRSDSYWESRDARAAGSRRVGRPVVHGDRLTRGHRSLLEQFHDRVRDRLLVEGVFTYLADQCGDSPDQTALTWPSSCSMTWRCATVEEPNRPPSKWQSEFISTPPFERESRWQGPIRDSRQARTPRVRRSKMSSSATTKCKGRPSTLANST
jgi:hypothetical protein